MRSTMMFAAGLFAGLAVHVAMDKGKVPITAS